MLKKRTLSTTPVTLDSNMEEKKTEGLLLKAIPYLNDQKILKVLTPNDGLISLIAKKKHQKIFLDPFLLAQFVFRKGKSEIHTLLDCSLIDDLNEIRQNLETINAAASIAKDLLNTQLPGKSFPKLFALSCIYLQKIPKIKNLKALQASFKLKLLIHEGLLNLADEHFFSEENAINAQVQFLPKQFISIKILAMSKSLQEITAQNLDTETELKILKLFKSLTDL